MRMRYKIYETDAMNMVSTEAEAWSTLRLASRSACQAFTDSPRLGTDAEPPRAKSGLQRRGLLVRFRDDDSLTNGNARPILETLAHAQEDTKGVRCFGRFVLLDSTTCGAERGKNQVQCA